MTQPPPDDDDTPRLPAEIEQLLRGLTGGEIDPQMASMMQGMGLDKIDPQMLAMVMGQVQAMFAAPEGDTAVNAVLATDIARKTVAAEGDELASAADRKAAAEAVQVAGMWLDAVTDLTTPGLTGAAWSRAEWVEATMPVWTDLVEPVAAGVTDAVGTALAGQLGQLGEAGLPAGMLDQAGPMLRRMHGSMFSMQLGQGTGTLAGEVLTGCEVSLPLVPAPTVVLMPVAVRDFAAGLEVDEPQARLYLAAREVARVRLFGAVPWLAPALLAAVRDYAADISIDTTAIEEAVGLDRPLGPRGRPAGAAGQDVRAPALPRPAGRPGPPRDPARARRGVGRRRQRPRHPRAPAAGRRARRGRAPPPRHGRTGREGLRCPRRARAAAAPAARRRQPVRRAGGVRRPGRP